MKKKALSLILCATAAVTLLAGCTGQDEKRLTENDYTTSIREAFNIKDGVSDQQIFQFGRTYCIQVNTSPDAVHSTIDAAYNMQGDEDKYAKFEQITQKNLCETITGQTPQPDEEAPAEG